MDGKEVLTANELGNRHGVGRDRIEFLLREDDAVLQVPSNALFRVQGQWAVFVEQAGRARQRVVEIDQQITKG